jgi:N-acetylmuramoyl-L-alanine amidase
VSAEGAGSAPEGSAPVQWDRGFAAASIGLLRVSGWDVIVDGDSATARNPDGTLLRVRAASPFVFRNDELLQLADAPYRAAGALFVPLQLLGELAGEPLALDASGHVSLLATNRTAPDRMVVIDAGHGGRDLGALGYGGVREKDVALALALELARELEERGYVVYLTRETDVFIPVWNRGALATEWRAGRPAVFVSLHANSQPGYRETRGFETYVMADARTEHERRLAAIENASAPPAAEGSSAEDTGLSFILGELVNLDHQHWSAHLANLVQEELATVHPGPNRGVKQAPLAVITNALMPSVLVEIGYVTNAAEEKLIAEPDFHRDAAGAMATAVGRFFAGYPPAQGHGTVGNPE